MGEGMLVGFVWRRGNRVGAGRKGVGVGNVKGRGSELVGEKQDLFDIII